MSARKQQQQLVADSWLLEAAAIILSVAALITIIVLLGHYDRKPLPDSQTVTLNSVISILATVARTAAAFSTASCLGQFKWIWFRAGAGGGGAGGARPLSDFAVLSEAAQGPWAGARLLIRTRSWSVVAIGGWAVVLGLLFGPFVQQIVSFRPGIIYAENNATLVPVASRWSAAQEQVSFVGLLDQTVTNFGQVLSEPRPHLSFTTQASIVGGLSLSTGQISQQLGTSCRSGTCKWKKYRSLGVCSACHDVTPDHWNVGSGTDMADQASWFGDTTGGIDTPANITWFDYHDYGGTLNMNNPDDYSFGNGSTERITMSGQANSDPARTLAFANSSTLLLAMSVMWADLDENYRYPDWPHANPTAAECGLYLCVKELDTTMVNGVLFETSREVASVRDLDSYRPIGSPAAKKLPIGSLYDEDQKIQRTDLRITSLPLDGRDRVESFNVSQAAVGGLVWYLSHAFDDRSMWSKIPNATARTITERRLMSGVTGLVRLVPGTHSFQFMPDIMQVFWTNRHGDGLDRVFANLATSLTNNMRNTADGNTTVSGSEGTVHTFIEIRWGWLGPPALTVILSAAFLAVTVRKNGKMGLPVWKDSSLAGLFHGLGGGVLLQRQRHVQLRPSGLRSEMERDARGVYSRLGGDTMDMLALEVVKSDDQSELSMEERNWEYGTGYARREETC